MPLNCAGLSESILEDELFGHVRGAYTGAQTDREGRSSTPTAARCSSTRSATCPRPMQAKLLRVLESGEVIRLGSNEVRRVDVRLISATNRNLDEMVAEKKFREDLFFRIKGISLHIPPLRERRPDIRCWRPFFMKQSAEKYGKKIDDMDPPPSTG